MAQKEDSLFLLEVLVDKIIFVKTPCFSDKDFRTCVNVECPSVKTLEICDDDPGTHVAKSDGPFIKTFNSGKSCLFSLKEDEISKAMSKFPVKVSIHKSLPCGCLPTKILMGEATIDMTKEFVEARNKFLEDPNSVSYQALKDSFRLSGSDGSEAGEIIMFLRISCFGKLIITKFQGSSGPNLQTSGASGPVDRSCLPQREYQSTQEPCVCGAKRFVGDPSRASCTVSGAADQGICPPARDPFNSMPCEEPDDPCYCSGPKQPAKQKMVCRNTDQYCLHVPKDCCPPGNKIIFQLPWDSCGTGHKQRAHFNYTSDGTGDIARDEPGQLAPTTSPDYQGVIYDLPSQVIKMRVAKTLEMPGRKSKMEYQFITPIVTHEKQVPVKDTRTAQCVPTCPGCCATKCTLLYMPRDEEYTDIGINKSEIWSEEVEQPVLDIFNNNVKISPEYVTASNYESSQLLTDLSNMKLPKSLSSEPNTDLFANSSFSIVDDTFKDENFSFLKSLYYFWYTQEKSKICELDSITTKEKKIFGNNSTTVYMTLYQDFGRRRCSGTQATGSINKCLQFDSNKMSFTSNYSNFNSKYSSTNLLYLNRNDTLNDIRNPDIYFFGRKTDTGKSKKGMGSQESLTRRYKQNATPPAKKSQIKTPTKNATTTQSKSATSSVSMQTKNSKVTSSGCSTKSVTIKANSSKPPCPAVGTVKGEMMATVSHIKIAPVQPCPIHGNDPCQGPKCIAATKQEEQGPVKVSTVSNPRRGVYELVIRKMTGAPLAKNELMLEWTPPPCRAPPCSSTCPSAHSKPSASCKQSKYKIVACRSPCKPKCSNKVYKRASSPMPRPPLCPPPSCKKCKPLCCGKPCMSCSPVPCGPPSSCISPCGPGPCCNNPCKSPCVSSPCLRPCPVGRKRPKRALSHPRIKAHPKRHSPCANRAKFCPAVRCKSPLPCIQCCNVTCYPRTFCSLTPSKPLSGCSSCCSTICG